jgi:hypothetical protein
MGSLHLLLLTEIIGGWLRNAGASLTNEDKKTGDKSNQTHARFSPTPLKKTLQFVKKNNRLNTLHPAVNHASRAP